MTMYPIVSMDDLVVVVELLVVGEVSRVLSPKLFWPFSVTDMLQFLTDIRLL